MLLPLAATAAPAASCCSFDVSIVGSGECVLVYSCVLLPVAVDSSERTEPRPLRFRCSEVVLPYSVKACDDS